ncbi:hypothetical protein [Photobacterium iliopiscarium]|uniref:hypothetical protein n=1 Tax=Photobacterium iliopiscarium TaxID=56192 RepID=UPI001E2BCB23|nr:hypothetical protein [Photobacterium iliopiscarium]MCD9467793.1 hypothetical protein [Photobacterium iliopiscarium]
MTEAPPHTNIDWQQIKILIIDDQPSSALLIQIILQCIDLAVIDIVTNNNINRIQQKKSLTKY